MTKKTVSRIFGLLLIPVVVISVCGWIPFTAPVTIHSVPEGANVYKAGESELLGTTPFASRVFHFNKSFDVKLDKYHDERVTINYSTMENTFVTMRPKPIVVYTKADADIYEAGAAEPFGKTPIEVEVKEEPRTCILKRADYFDEEITIGLESKNPIVLELAHRPIIEVLTVQEDVKIYENGTLIAEETITEEIIEPRTFEFQKEGHYKKTVVLTPDQTHELSYTMTVDLEPLPVITIETEPASAEVYMVGDSNPLGTGSVELMIEQETAFEIKADRYYSKSINIEPKTQTANIKLDAMPYVMIKSQPSGASVTVGGKAIGTTPVEQLIENPVEAVLTLDGYKPKTVTLSSGSQSPVVLEKAPPPPPMVTISSTPAGASVSVDEKSIGNTPVDQAVAKPITVTLTLDGYHPQTVTLDGSNLKPMITLKKKGFFSR